MVLFSIHMNKTALFYHWAIHHRIMSIYNHRPIPNKKIGNNPQEILLQQFQKQDVNTVPKTRIVKLLFINYVYICQKSKITLYQVHNLPDESVNYFENFTYTYLSSVLVCFHQMMYQPCTPFCL